MIILSIILASAGILGTLTGEYICAGFVVLAVCNLLKRRTAMAMTSALITYLTLNAITNGKGVLMSMFLVVLMICQLLGTFRHWKKGKCVVQTA